MSDRRSVDICVATYKNPTGLRLLLESIGRLRTTDVSVRVIVVDNDSEGSAQAVVNDSRANLPHAIEYVVEKEKGIAHARNRALSLVDADFLAFVDDDERMAEDWLSVLLATAARYEADIVFGAVHKLLPDEAPEWARMHPAFLSSNFKTGALVNRGSTANVLIKTQSFDAIDGQFDPEYSETGGEDTDVFHRMHLAGLRLVLCNEAVVTEDIAPSRIDLSWVSRRAFRGGQTFFRVIIRRRSVARRILWFLDTCSRLVLGAVLLAVMRLFSYKAYTRQLAKVLSRLGQASMVFGDVMLYEEYSKGRYRVEAEQA